MTVPAPPGAASPVGDATQRFDGARDDDSASRTWHLLDNGPLLERHGIEPVGTILCVHGNPTWSYLWRELVAAATDLALAGGTAWRVVAVDQLEMGFSQRFGRSRLLAERVGDLAALTAHLALTGPVVTLGHDWGGVVSLGWAVDHPELVTGVMLLNTAVHHPAGQPVPAPLRLALNPGVLTPGTVLTPAFLETTLALAHPALPAGVRAAYRAPYAEAARRGGIGGFVADIPLGEDHPSKRELDRIASGVRELGRAEVPALLLWGPRDPIFSDRYLADLIDRLPSADVHRFEGAGHLLAEDVDYADAVLTWLDDNMTPRADSSQKIETDDADASGGAYQHPGGVVSARRMWDVLDQMRESSQTALVEMAPTTGSGPRVVTWRLLSRRIEEIAAGLVATGVRPGDRVSLLVPPGADLTAVLYACLRIGAVVVVADAGLGLRGLTRAVRGARPAHVIGALPGLAAARALSWPGQRVSTQQLSSSLARTLGVQHSLADLVDLGSDRSLPDAPDRDATAAILFTSGSTGPAKGVAYTHRQLEAMRDVLSEQYEIGVGTGLVAGFAPFALLGPALGARSVTPDMDVTSPATLTAKAVAAAVAAADASVVFLSPAAVANVVATQAELTAADRDVLERVRVFLSAGAPVSPDLLSAVNALMPNASAHTPYGMTEGLLIADIDLPGIRDATSVEDGPGGVCVGRPTSTASVRIAPLDGRGSASNSPTTAVGVTGEILVRAPHVKDHYDRLWLTERMSRAIDPAAGSGWHRTGDVGHLDPEGRLWIEGRLAHVVTTPEGVVTPVGLEQRIEAVAAVSRSAVVGVGPNGTQQVVAVIELEPRVRRVGLAEPGLAAAVRRAAGRELAAVLVVPRIPTDIRHNSKIDRTHLAQWAERSLSGGRMRRP